MVENSLLTRNENTTDVMLPAETENEDLPCFQNNAYQKMQPAWTLCQDVYEGTFRIRDKGKHYIPQFPLESDESHRDRIGAAVLMNVYARTVDAMTGLVIGSGLKTTGVPKRVEPHLKNIDNAGTELEVFARDLLRDAFDGHAVVLIDMPAIKEEDKPKNKTEERKMDLRPHWTRKRPDEIYNWRTEVINGETVTTQITFKEVVSVPHGAFGEKEETRYISWKLNLNEKRERFASFTKFVELEEEYQKTKREKATRVRYKVIDQGTTHMKRIPMFVVYGNQTDGKVLESKPPLLDLAHKNVEHLQIDSDYKKGLSIAGIALPVIKTDKTDDELEQQKFAWDKFMVVGKDEDFKFEEANGAALPNKKIALDDIKREMGVLGLSLIAERADANITATERLLDSVQQSNQLMAIQASLVQGLRKGLEIHAEWLKVSSPDSEKITVALGLDWTELVRSADHMQLILEMAKEDFVSTLTLLESAGKYGVLPSYINAEEEVARLKTEGRKRESRLMMKSTATGLEVDDKGKTSKSPGEDTSMGHDKEKNETEKISFSGE